MKFHYDKKEDALYLRFNESPYAESEEVRDGVIFDFDKRGKIVGLEILNVSKKFPRKFKSEIIRQNFPPRLSVESRTKIPV